MSDKWFKLEFGIAIAAVLVAVVLISSGTRIPGFGQTASVIDAIPTDTVPVEPTSTESAPTDSAIPTESTSTDPASTTESVLTEPAPEASADTSNLTEILQVLLPPLPIENSAPTAPKGVPNLKVFVQDQETLESTINEWLAVQQGIAIDEFKIDAYDGVTYLVVISYHTDGIGKASTRIKFFKSEGLDNSIEAPAQAFLSSLSSSQTVRSIIPAIGMSGSVFMFIVYE